MKQLYLIGGPMGVGKTHVAQVLKKKLPKAVYLDGDWCWDSDPFVVTAETKAMVQDNISYLLSNFLKCSAYEHVIFTWVMHEIGIIEALLQGLQGSHAQIHLFSLQADEDSLRSRLQQDVQRGLRSEDVIARSLERLPNYQNLPTIKIDTTHKGIEEVAEEIMAYSK